MAEVKPEPAKEARPPTRTLLIEITDQHGGTREVYEPDVDLMRELGWVREVQYGRRYCAEHGCTTWGVPCPMGEHATNGANGNPIPDLVTLPSESAIKRDDETPDPVRVMGANGRQIDEALTGEPIAMTEHGEKMYGARGPSLTPLEVLGGAVVGRSAAVGDSVVAAAPKREGKLPSELAREIRDELIRRHGPPRNTDALIQLGFDVMAEVLDERLGRA